MSRNSRIRAKKARTKTNDENVRKVLIREVKGAKIYALYKD
tara:strand:+ start:23195 stop:23317 length:123 start_codon:yes stop_codon:yes gene_type:complete